MKETPPSGRVMSLFVVWTMVFSALVVVGTIQSTTNAKAATQCSQSNVIIGSDWTVIGTADELCEGTIYTMTGNLIVNGKLELRNGGIVFAPTVTHQYSVQVSGTLVLNHSIITVTDQSLNPSLKLPFNILQNGHLSMIEDSALAFPGWLNTTAGGTTTSITMDHSDIRRAAVGTGSDAFAPVMTFDDARVRLYDSAIQDLYSGTADSRRNITLGGNTNFLAINTYLGLNFDNENGSASTHNSLMVGGTSKAYLLWPTLADTCSPPCSDAVDTSSGTEAYIYRRVNVTVIDKNGAPIGGATIGVTYSGTTTAATYMDNPPGFARPSADVLTYLGETGNWGTTNPAGVASLPLISDKIDNTGVHFWGNYNVSSTSPAPTVTEQISLAHWPVADIAFNFMDVTLQLTTQQMPLPDLTPVSVTFDPTNMLEDRTMVDVTVKVSNTGPGAAINVNVSVYFNSEAPGGLIHSEIIPFIDRTTTITLNPFTWTPPANSGGNNLIIVWTDKQLRVVELREDNNRISYPVYVTPLGADLATAVGAMTGFVANPVDLVASVSNQGDRVASGVSVSFYLGSLGNLLGTNNSVHDITVGNTTQVTFTWTPTSEGIYQIYAQARSNIQERLPYNITNNIDNNTLAVTPSPNPTAYSDEIGLVDPYPNNNTAVDLYATVRNIGQAGIGQLFSVKFSIDGAAISTEQTPSPTLGVGDQVVVQSSPWQAVGCGFHTLQVDVDSTNVIQEGRIFEADNKVTRTIQVFGDRAPLTYSTDVTLQYLPVAQSIIITGHMIVENGSVVVTQPQEACGQVYIKIMNGGSLTLVNSTITATDDNNWPLVIYVGGTPGSRFEAIDSKILLNTYNGDGILEVGPGGIINLTDTIVDGDISAHGQSATFNRVMFKGERLHTYTTSTTNPTRIWDPVFVGTDYIALRSDDQVASTLDVDLRNATLGSVLTQQLVFGGHQWAEITNVTTTQMTRWWEGAITQKAKVTRCWWLTVEAVDGTGAPLKPEANAFIDVTRQNTQTLGFDPIVPTPILYDTVWGPLNNTWPPIVPKGVMLLKAPAEDRFADIRKQWTNATYKVTGSATINGTPYDPDTDVVGFVNQSMTLRIRFSALTPDLVPLGISFSSIAFGAGSSQPLNVPVDIFASVENKGRISQSGIKVDFFFTDVKSLALNPGYMDYLPSTYAGFFIGSDVISIDADGTAIAHKTWNQPAGTSANSFTISVVVDPPIVRPTDGGAIRETDETNNILETSVAVFPWPDLHLAITQIQVGRAVKGSPTAIAVTVTNFNGTNSATGARVELRVDGSLGLTAQSAAFDVARGDSALTEVIWTPPSAGNHTLSFYANVTGIETNRDYHQTDNTATMTIQVNAPPDLLLIQSEYLHYPPSYYNMTQGSILVLGQTPYSGVKIYNAGSTPATSTTLGAYLNSNLLVAVSGINVSADGNHTVTLTIPWSNALSNAFWFNITLFADSTNAVVEDNENNNMVNITVHVVLPQGTVEIAAPTAGTKFVPGDTIIATGRVASGNVGLVGIPLTAELLDSNNNVLASLSDTSSVDGGYYTFQFSTTGRSDGDYTIRISSTQTTIQPSSVTVSIKGTPVFTIFGLPLWLFLLIIIIIIVVVVGIVLYTRSVGLGKMVECGECGAFIPEDSTKCPKCGVEFEKDMAKCSNCQAWIPLDVKECPECHVKFATGEIEMADYEQKMRAQYDVVKAKFREEAEKELGAAMSDQEFEDWWRKQPTFMTFEDWLREEEEMRKMGSKACPTCGTLNSVTATVCHKCGTLMKKEEGRKPARPPQRGGGEAPRRETARPTETTQAAEPRPTEPIPKKVVVKKPIAPTVIQKKVVVKKPVEEGKEGEEGTSGEEQI